MAAACEAARAMVATGEGEVEVGAEVEYDSMMGGRGERIAGDLTKGAAGEGAGELDAEEECWGWG